MEKIHKEFCQFLYVAMGSLAEVETQLIIAQNLKFIEKIDNQSIDEIRKMLNGLIYKLR